MKWREGYVSPNFVRDISQLGYQNIPNGKHFHIIINVSFHLTFNKYLLFALILWQHYARGIIISKKRPFSKVFVFIKRCTFQVIHLGSLLSFSNYFCSHFPIPQIFLFFKKRKKKMNISLCYNSSHKWVKYLNYRHNSIRYLSQLRGFKTFAIIFTPLFLIHIQYISKLYWPLS